ncbi:MAG: SRPBCC family protein [Gemmataceae bacterium]
MFVHPERLQHVLTPEWYYSPEIHAAELRLLEGTWHYIASLAELPRDGSFLTRTLLGRPLLLRRIQGEVHAYLNVCPHRHCLLTSKPHGHDPAFRCQYHGWEFQCDGRTGKIPDAQSFRPFDRDNARLLKFRTQLCGDLVFVSLASQGPDLKEQLGEVHDVVEEVFSAPWRQIWQWENEIEANWKIPLENGVESYHIPCLHPKTFRNYPQEDNIAHDLNARWTSYRTGEMDGWVRNAIRRTARWLGQPFTGMYTHYHVFPNLTFVRLDLFSMAQIVLPTSPTTSRTWVWVFSPFGPRRGIIPWLFAQGNALASREIARAVLAEDGPIFPAVQRGLEASPARGVIGRREERVWAFQDHLLRLCALREGR